MSEPLPWITYKQFADLHGISVSTVKNLIRDGELVAAKVTKTGAPRITPEEVARFRKERGLA